MKGKFRKLVYYKVEPAPKIMVSHEVRSQTIGKRQYELTPIHYPRPGQGWQSAYVRCRVCGENVKVNVADMATTTKRLWKWRLWYAAFLALIAVAGVIGASEVWGRGGSIVAIILATTVLPFTAMIFIGILGLEDGVKLASDIGPHQLKYPGDNALGDPLGSLARGERNGQS